MISIGVQTWGTDVVALRRLWTAADRLGYARIAYGDGLGDFTHDGWTMLGALASLTSRARVAHAVTYAFGAAAHHPSWLAKRAVAADHLSGGRFDLRLAVGAEDIATAALWRAHDIAYPDAASRIAALEESVTVVRALWSGEAVDHQGAHYRLRGARLAPRPVQQPGPPVWVAAMGPRALGAVARCADGWEASYVTPEDFAGRWARLHALLREHGRGETSLRRSVELDVVLADGRAATEAALARFCARRRIARDHPFVASVLAGSPATVAERIAAWEAAGATDLMLGFADTPATAMLETFAARVLPRLGRPRPVSLR
ncbi:MAG: LLM class flavin-dependent oxidoreductase [Candidatus Rokubacteria bacterium]|nr:LLM class flavin-dependent oxidoreductase [Candidatus Rokubacteria bacterium]